jgi:hypothetical protein
MYLCNWAESHKSERAAMMQRRSLSWMMWEVSTAAISRKRNRSSVASAVLRAAEAVVLVDVSMDLVRRGGCVEVNVTWDFARFVVDSSDQCCEERRNEWSRLGLTSVHGQRSAEEGPDGNHSREHGLRRCEAVGQIRR